MKEYLVYLAGPIFSASYEKSVQWREYVQSKLYDTPIKTLSPMRGKTYLMNEVSVKDSYEDYALSSARGITTRDRMDVARCDMMLAYLDEADKASIGTSIEFGWADAYRKPVVAVMNKGNVHWHGMIREISGFIVPTLDEAIDIIYRVLLPEDDQKTFHVIATMRWPYTDRAPLTR